MSASFTPATTCGVISQADILRQVTSASFQALNIGSGMTSSSSANQSNSCSTSYSYSENKEVEDEA